MTEAKGFFRFAVDKSFGVDVYVDFLAVLVLAAALTVGAIIWHFVRRQTWRQFEIDQAEIGIGDHKLTFRPNDTDRTIAYKIWVELSTRKVGIAIDPDDDVISEIYDSWYEFFAITRELTKEIPVNKVQQTSTQKIIKLSIEVLNQGLRPHLTKWQARFRRWYEYQQRKDPNADLHPQEIQKTFPAYEELVADMMVINGRLIEYRRQMQRLVLSL